MAFYIVDNTTLKAENPPPPGTSPLVRLRKLVVEQEKDLAFLEKAAAYFASTPPRRSDWR